MQQAREEGQRKGGGPVQCLRRVMLVDDHPLIRDGLAGMLALEPDLEVCGQTGSAAKALQLIEALSPDVVVVDLTLADGSGIDLLRNIQLQFPGLPTLVVSIHDERLYAERALRAGARGYVMKQEPSERVLEGIRAVLGGSLFVSPKIAGALLNAYVNGPEKDMDRVGIERLSNRELQVFEGVGNGLSTAEIAARLNLSPKTVETYRAHIQSKLGLENNRVLVHSAIRWVEQERLSRPHSATS